MTIKQATSWLSQPGIVAMIHDPTTKRALRVAVKALERLPSAQPEIIQCKDCKHWMPYEWMFSEVWQSQNIDDYPEDEISCNYCDVHMKSSDFCSQAVRREVTT